MLDLDLIQPESLPARSAIVRVSFNIRWYALVDKFIYLITT